MCLSAALSGQLPSVWSGSYHTKMCVCITQNVCVCVCVWGGGGGGGEDLV